ncbi:endoplasmin homolog isoform X1 [Telopea speciosissima]|uniref:endoplasmin homolog isoform X1 n=1 Tax=Telopea speciosissima TaxID=54955 RepID=UPI001CC358F0|nr:endoplasmin homolog isoform X1 [Telopea speciosissima]
MFSAESPARKWLGFVTAVWVQSISGNNYTFSNYSAALKSLMALTQLQLNNLSVAKDVGKAFGILAGLASDRLPTPLILLIGSIEGLIGYGVQWLVVSQRIRPLPYWQMCIFLCMGGNSTTWMNTAILVTCMRNFRKNRGPVSGILKGYVGLSTAIFTDLCSALFSDSPSSFLLMLAIIPAVVCFTAVLVLRETPPNAGAVAEKEETHDTELGGEATGIRDSGKTMRNWTISSALLLLLLLSLLPDQGRNIHANAEESESEELVDPPKIEDKIGAVPNGLSTDSDVVKREAESISKKSLRSNAEKFEFQAEVSRLMDILINSLYSNKDIFLRELISNASDALDKIRFLSLTDKEILGEGDNTKLEIEIKLDKEKKVISIRDRGIGMTKEDLIKNLGTIAKSGTSAFVEKMQTSGDLNLIGQFGVGFYSVYLVADYVEVISKHNDDKQYIWESKADGAFAISEDEYNEPLGRGTEIRLHLREEAQEYLEEDKLKELVKKYSEFINFPIYIWASKEVDVEVPADEDSSEEEETTESSSSEEEAEEEDSEKKPKTKTVKETTYEWELLNDMKAVWLRNPKDVTNEEYTKFYHSLAKDFGDEKPLAWSHFSAEGDVEFKSILFVPPKAPHDLYESYYNSNKANLKLYVRRVFISDEFDELLPKYLNFLKGLVDSDTLPLNVSREMLQQHNSLKTIKKKLIRKALDMIRKIAEEDPDEANDKDNKEAEKSSDNDEKKGQYAKFWNEFGKSIKLGIVEDAANRNRLAKLLRVETTKSGGKLTSLDQYISRMKPGQKDIFYITGTSKEQLETSPFLERLKKKNYEVIFFTDPVDEYLMQYLMDYEDKKFQNVSKEGLKLGKESKDKEVKESFKELTKWWKGALASENVDDVKISNRLDNSPCVVVTSKYGWSANMERIMQSQTLSDANKQAYMRGKRVLEINPRHPIIKELRDRVVKEPEDENVKQTARLMYQTALMESGFVLNDPKDFASSIYSSVKNSLKISPDAAVEEEDDAEEVETEVKGDEARTTEDDSDTEESFSKDEL